MWTLVRTHRVVFFFFFLSVSSSFFPFFFSSGGACILECLAKMCTERERVCRLCCFPVLPACLRESE